MKLDNRKLSVIVAEWDVALGAEVALLEDVVEAGRTLQDEYVSYMADGYIVEEVRLEKIWKNFLNSLAKLEDK